MPISPIVLQRRHAELGRIRLGNKGDRGQPQKLSNFRFTSPSERYIGDLATLYGGEPQPWDNSGVRSWEVHTTATTVPVIAVKGGLSQWLEFWQGGGCVHRCDGENNVLTGEACDHEEKVKTRVRGQDVWVNPHAEAKPTTRLSVMLPELEAIGVWRMESHGWNAAAEIPAVAELATFVGDLVPAHLHLVERRSVKDGKTSRFVVPVLDLQIGTARLREIVAAKSGGELTAGPERAALEAGASDGYAVFFQRVADAVELDDLVKVWDDAKTAKVVGPEAPNSPRLDEFVSAWKKRAHEIKDAQPVEGEIVNDDTSGSGDASADAVWEQIVRTAGSLQPPMTTDQIHEDFKTRFGMTPDVASAQELQHYHDEVLAGRQGADA